MDLAATSAPIAATPASRAADAETLIVNPPAPAPAEEPEAPASGTLVDAFSALLAAEEGDGGVVAGPVEMEAAPVPVPPPAVEWTPGHAHTAEPRAAAPAGPRVIEHVPGSPAVSFERDEAPVFEPAPVEAATVLAGAAVATPPSAPPAALRADAPEGALDGIDLDVFADAVAQKILHRLTDARIDAIVSERVLEIAERLVREEIERIKADAQ